MRVLAIDPGSEQSAWAELRWDGSVIDTATISNKHMADWLSRAKPHPSGQPEVQLVIEMIGHYGTGMPAGKTVFDTCVWIGEFKRAWKIATGQDVQTILRPTVKAHICGSARAKDGNVRQALIDRFGGKDKAIGKKATPGPLYGIKGDEWAALAVALTWYDQNQQKAGAA